MKYGKIICDPTSEEAKALIGKKVLFGDGYMAVMNLIEKSVGVGTLKYIDENSYYPFTMSNKGGYKFIREVIEEKHKYVPYDLSNPATRKKLRGRWFRDTTDEYEACITRFYHADEKCEWHAEIYTAEELLSDCVWDDGTPCGEGLWNEC